MEFSVSDKKFVEIRDEYIELAEQGNLSRFEIEKIVYETTKINSYFDPQPNQIATIVNSYCEKVPPSGFSDKDSALEEQCVQYYLSLLVYQENKDYLNRNNNNDRVAINPKYPQTIDELRERLKQIQKKGEKIKPYTTQKVSKASQTQIKEDQDPQKLFDPMVATFLNYDIEREIKSNNKDNVISHLKTLEDYWVSAESEAYSWSGMLKSIRAANHYLQDHEKEHAYICTSYIQSHAEDGRSWFSLDRTPSYFLENYVKHIHYNDVLLDYFYAEFTKLCLQELIRARTSTESQMCKAQFKIDGLNDGIMIGEKNIENAIEYLKLNPNAYDPDFESCNKIAIKQSIPTLDCKLEMPLSMSLIEVIN
ncbi:hypothetical protein DKW60_20605 [Leucothrix pacifica]|uniref:Uncharacterized protein n=2 Tax=Leucothrix pacifica TaxID=1247513 RepID=A0A317C8F0_9GAMM|nr:hypothetical protein DKW60_20605 [Leucothrix pacifica]